MAIFIALWVLQSGIGLLDPALRAVAKKPPMPF
jgi:hypothetical protein